MKWNNILMLIFAICFGQLASGQRTDKRSDKLMTITGKVFNLDRKGVEGAVFYIDNIKTSYTTKSNGSYKIKVSPSAHNLEVHSSQYGSCEKLINGQTNINFTLDGISDNLALDPRDTARIYGPAFNSDKPARTKSKKMNTYNNIYQMIRGEVSGVMVSGRSIQIQQGHSFFGGSEPLYVVNGIIVPSIDNINPVEVKSITVLKGTSAAIYGVRGANGVLSITLINGSEKE
jgi:TonB-dependent SusC/RagA subfamily outer membrane receptor